MSHLDWHVGMKVVCVDNSTRTPPPGWRFGSRRVANHIDEGAVYTIRGMYIDPLLGSPCIWLNEVHRTTLPDEAKAGIVEPGFLAERFRPAQTRKTDISIFTAMLTGSNSKVPA